MKREPFERIGEKGSASHNEVASLSELIVSNSQPLPLLRLFAALSMPDIRAANCENRAYLGKEVIGN